MHLTNKELLLKTHELVRQERALNTEVLLHLKEIDERRLYLEQGYSSLFDMCLKAFGYSNAAAQRRIEAMRLLRAVPEVESKLKEGRLNLTTAAQIQSFFRQETHPSSHQEKLELLESLENKPSKDVERELIKRNPEMKLTSEKLRPVTEDRYELKLTLSKDLHDQLEQLKALLSHKQLKGFEGLLQELAEIALKKLDPARARKQQTTQKQSVQKPQTPMNSEEQGDVQITSVDELISAAEATSQSSFFDATTEVQHNPSVQTQSRSRHIPNPIRRAVWNRDEGRCTYAHPETQHRCGSTHFVQLDHITPFSEGGLHTKENLRLLCGRHNRERMD